MMMASSNKSVYFEDLLVSSSLQDNALHLNKDIDQKLTTAEEQNIPEKVHPDVCPCPNESVHLEDLLVNENKEYVGFSALPGQVHRKTVKKGFEFTLMVVGESGLGKSTLINSLFLTDLYKDRKVPTAEERIEPTVSLEDHTMDFEEKGVRMRLTIIDTPGFADSVNNTNCWDTVVKCVEDRLGKYLHDESGLNRRHINDSRVHCCLYFISPFGRGLRPVDVACLTALHDRVNILPVIGKADCLTYTELRALKQQVRDDLERHSIRTYEFPDCDSEEEDEEYKIENQKLKESVPFAVVGSNMVVEVNGRKVRGRLYPWGIVEGERVRERREAYERERDIDRYIFVQNVREYLTTTRNTFITM
uniref:Septin-7 n=1 Tax=Eptatretus burgeri TaxID=7764 RepID=A0A8C4PYH2_EPTBU